MHAHQHTLHTEHTDRHTNTHCTRTDTRTETTTCKMIVYADSIVKEQPSPQEKATPVYGVNTFCYYMCIVAQGDSDLVLALTKTIITQATITHEQNNGFALDLVNSYNTICPTTMEKEMSKYYLVCFPTRNNLLQINWDNLGHHGVIRTSM